MNIRASKIYLLSSEYDSSVTLDAGNNLVYLSHSCLWLCFTESEFNFFVKLINEVEYQPRRNKFPLGKEGVLLRSALPGIGFRLEEMDLKVLKIILNKALHKLNYRPIMN